MTLEKMQEITAHFAVEGKLIYVEPFGGGHINTTYAVYFAFENRPTLRYIVQKVNTSIFTQAEKLMDNIASVTEFLKEKVRKEGGNPDREVLSIVKNLDGSAFYKDEEGGFYRLYHFVENATCYQIVTKDLFYQSAKAFGKFAKDLDGFEASGLFDVIENFHNTVDRFQKFQKSVAEDSHGRKKDCLAEIEFVMAREGFCSLVLDEIATGNIPLRVCHNDTKLNNVMIDNHSHEGVCVIDLDTIMKGSLLYDFGDSIRFGASSALEDEEDLSLVYCDLEKYQSYIQGYLEETKDILSPKEAELLHLAGKLMTLECGMRFLTDYLQGDVYFRVHKEEHNLIRARNQFKLVESMEENVGEMERISREAKMKS